MSFFALAVIGGIWLSLMYAATVTPATVWVIQLTVSRGWMTGLSAALALTIGQLPWCLAAALLMFHNPEFWQSIDLWLRAGTAAFFLWMAVRSARAPRLAGLRVTVNSGQWPLFKQSLWRSLAMPWRLPIWIGLIISMSLHLRGYGWSVAIPFTLGAIFGQAAWHLHFVLIAGLFGNRVPDDISLHSMNKLRLLATMVLGGLVLVVLAPIGYAGT